MTRIAINGLGRIGRRLLRLLVEERWMDGNLEVVAVNDVLPADLLAYLVKHDSLHGRAPFDVGSAKSRPGLAEDDLLVVDGREIPSFTERYAVDALPWRELGVDIVIESTGMHAQDEGALFRHLRAGARCVLVTAMSPPADIMIVPGVNHERYDPAKHRIISTGAALTQAITPVLHALCDGGHGIEEGSITLLQCLYPTLPVLDRPSKRCWREGRAMHNLIPGFHGGAREASLALPELRGRLVSSVVFAPVSGVCAAAMMLRMDRAAALSEVLDSLRLAAQRGTSGSLGYSEDPIVSSDVLGDTRSAVIATRDVTAASEHLFCVPLFYDPEASYASRVLDVLDLIVRKQG